MYGITTYSPLRKWKIGKGHKVAVLGLGGLGHMAVKFAVSFGAEVTVLSTSPGKESDAKKLGAHNFCNTKDADQVKKYKAYFDFIIDTVSVQHNYDMYLQMLAANGVQVLVGIPSTPITFSAFSLLTHGRTISASSIGSMRKHRKCWTIAQPKISFQMLKSSISTISMKRMNV